MCQARDSGELERHCDPLFQRDVAYKPYENTGEVGETAAVWWVTKHAKFVFRALNLQLGFGSLQLWVRSAPSAFRVEEPVQAVWDFVLASHASESKACRALPLPVARIPPQNKCSASQVPWMTI